MVNRVLVGKTLSFKRRRRRKAKNQRMEAKPKIPSQKDMGQTQQDTLLIPALSEASLEHIVRFRTARAT